METVPPPGIEQSKVEITEGKRGKNLRKTHHGEGAFPGRPEGPLVGDLGGDRVLADDAPGVLLNVARCKRRRSPDVATKGET